MDRRDQYKTSGINVESQRSKRRDQEAEIRKEKREKLLSSKRVRFSEVESDSDVEDFTVDQVQELARAIQKSDKNNLNNLKSLRKAFAQGSELISAFLGIENALRSMVGYLTGNNAQFQLEAAWCITNLATGVHEDTMKVLKASAAYLITYLSGQNVQLQDQCAWALGNFSGDSQECRDILRAQGIIVPMVNLLKVLQWTFAKVDIRVASTSCQLIIYKKLSQACGGRGRGDFHVKGAGRDARQLLNP